MTEKELNTLESALASTDPQAEINKACKKILCDRLQWDKQPDRTLRYLLEDVVNSMDFPIYPDEREILVPNVRKALAFGSLTVAGLCFTMSCKPLVRLLGGVAATVGGFKLSKSLNNVEKPVTFPSSEEIGGRVDAVYAALSRFYVYRQLDGHLIRILVWLQHLYSEDKSGELRASITRLLDLYGYKFVNMTPENSSDFEINKGNVSTAVTTEPAIYNDKGFAVCRGTAVIPKD